MRRDTGKQILTNKEKEDITVGAIKLISKEKVGSRRQGEMLVIDRKWESSSTITKYKDKIPTMYSL